jgi:hypothetical protein
MIEIDEIDLGPNKTKASLKKRRGGRRFSLRVIEAALKQTPLWKRQLRRARQAAKPKQSTRKSS